jgi:MFS family permease
MLGPLLGGFLYEDGGYYAVFIVTFAIIGVDIALRLLIIERKDARKWLELIAATVGSPVQSMRDDTENENTVKGDALFTVEPDPEQLQPPSRKRRVPSVLVLLMSPRMLINMFSYFSLSILMTSFDSVLPIFVHVTFNWGKTAQGLIFIPLCVPHFLEPLWGKVGDRNKKAWRLFGAGAYFACVPGLVLLRLVSFNSFSQKVFLCALLVLIGLCLSMILPTVMAEVAHILKDIEAKKPGAFGKNGAIAQAYALMNCAFAAGSLIGPVWAGFVREHLGWGTMTWTLALLSGVTAVPILLGLGGWIGNLRNGEIE